jgi:hypothetical protein
MTSNLGGATPSVIANKISPSASILRRVSSEQVQGALAPRLLARARCWLQKSYQFNTPKRLRIVETVSLGEKRFVALVRVEECEFLVGGGVAGISLLAQLRPAPSTSGCNVKRGSQ